ncbi:MAG: hypothetical protein AXW17_06950 [Colwellia sp. Phe_37]|nr:MAG: hypothetical protein AXW17_06950 [Colwellia sp. Phe_37]
MKITFVVPELNLTGGLRVISIYADLLSRRGHEVTVVSPNERAPTLKERIKSFLNWKGYKFKRGFDQSFFEGANHTVKVIKNAGEVTANDVPDADIIIATFWITAEWLAKYPESKGKKIYFIQHHEVHEWLPVERVKTTFKLPFKKIVVAQWLASTLENEYQQSNVAVVTNAVDHKLFHAPARQKNMKVTFGLMYSGREYKGSRIAFNSLNQLKKQYPFIRVVAFGLEAPEKVIGLPESAEYFSQPNQNQIRDIYSQCDAWLFTSSSEGFGLPILEAMACRTPVIGTCCGAAPDLLSSGGGILVDIGDHVGLQSAMEEICDMKPNDWSVMSNRAYKEALSHDWGEKAAQFEQAMLVE